MLSLYLVITRCAIINFFVGAFIIKYFAHLLVNIGHKGHIYHMCHTVLFIIYYANHSCCDI